MDSLSSLSFNSNSISIIHINICSLQKNFDSLQEFLCLLPNMPKIICLSESRINQKPLVNLELPSYKLVHIDSPTPAGEVAVYVSNELRIEIVSNLSLNIDGCENMWIKLCHLDIILGVIYRHPKSNVKLFVDELNKTLEQLKTTKVYLIGDINVNIFSINNAKYASDYSNMLASNGYFPLITLPTRVNDASSTLIDHLITNDLKNSIFPGIIKTDLTEHYPIFCSINTFTFSNKLNQQLYKRDLLNFNAENFCEDLHKSMQIFFPQDNAINSNNLNKIFSDFIKIVKTAIDNYAPLIKLSRRQRKLKLKPWITRGLLISIKHKKKLYLSHFINRNTEKRNFYKKYANKLTKIKLFLNKCIIKMSYINPKIMLLKLGKSLNHFFLTVIKSERSDLMTFQVLQNSSPTPNEIKYNGNLITISATISESFNSYFSKVGLVLSAEFNQHDTNSYKKFLPKFNSSSLFIQPTSEPEVIRLSGLSHDKSICHTTRLSGLSHIRLSGWSHDSSIICSKRGQFWLQN